MIQLRVTGGRLESVAFAPDGRGLAACGRGGVWAWADVSDAGPVFRLSFWATGVGYVSAGRALLVASERSSLWRFELNGIPQKGLADLRHGRLAVSAYGAFAAVTDGYAGRLSVWAVATETPIRLWTVDGVNVPSSAGPTFTPDGSAVLVPNPNPLAAVRLAVSVWNTATGAKRADVPVPVGASTPVAVHPDGTTLAFGGGNRLVVGSLHPDAGPPEVLPASGKQHLTAVAFHPSGRWLAAASNDTTVRLYDTGSWAVAKTFAWDAGRVRCLAFSPDGTLAAAGTDKGRVVVWDVDG